MVVKYTIYFLAKRICLDMCYKPIAFQGKGLTVVWVSDKKIGVAGKCYDSLDGD